MADELPPIVTRLLGDVSGLRDALVTSKAEVAAWRDEVSSGGREAGEKLGKDIGDGIQDAVPATLGQRLGTDIGAGIEQGLRDADVASPLAPDGAVGREIVDNSEKTGGEAGKRAGDAAAGGMSPLIKTAIGAAFAIGPAALVTGTAAAVAGATALILKGNAVIGADYQKLGADVSATLKNAAAPLTADVHAALGALDSQVVGLQPKLQSLFGAAAPDLAALTGGLGTFTGQVLPGLTASLSGSQEIVTDFSNSLGPLGSGVGSFFQNVVRDASTEGAALQHVVGTIGNAFSSLGTVVGSLSADASSALLAVTPAINGVLTAVQKVSNPATVGGLVGFFGAMKLDSGIQSGLLTGAEGLSKVADRAEEAGGLVGKLGGVASGASGALGKLASFVGGPWALALGTGVGLATALGAALFNASHATDAVKVSSDQLAQAVAQDGGKVGESTTAFLAQQDAANGLADTASKAGVSLAVLAQAAAGNKNAMAQLTGSVDKSNLATRQQSAAQDDATHAAMGFTSLTQQQTDVNDHAALATNKLTDANAKLVNSVKAQAQQTADAITKQTQLLEATNALNSATNIFNATLAADYQGLVSKAQQTADTTVAALNLGDAQSSLNQWLAGSVTDYQMAQSGASAYAGVLDSVNGSANTLHSTAAGFTIALDNMTTAVKGNGLSLDENNAKGAANVQSFTQIASSADKAAAAVYQSEVNTKGASQAYADANTKLVQEKDAFIAAADKAGFNKQQVQELANELYALPKDIPVAITANTAAAYGKITDLLSFVNSSSATIHVYENDGAVRNTGMTAQAKALGGFIDGAPGAPVPVLAHGQEYVLSREMLAGTQPVDPGVLAALRSYAGGGTSGGGVALAPAAAGGAPVVVQNVNAFYIDGAKITGAVRASAQKYARRNSSTGFN